MQTSNNNISYHPPPIVNHCTHCQPTAITHLKVQIIGWLVEDQDVGTLHEHRCEVQPPPLTAAQGGHILVLPWAGEAQLYKCDQENGRDISQSDCEYKVGLKF